MKRSRLKRAVVKPEVGKLLKGHLENILNYLRPITNAANEGLNSKIQTNKSNARGFRSLEN